MSNQKPDLKDKDIFYDKKLDRYIQLIVRINPQGKEVLPYWQVENTLTNKKTNIRENRLKGVRYALYAREGEDVERTPENVPPVS